MRGRRGQGSQAPFRRLVAAELLKLRRRRALFTISFALVVAPMLVAVAVLVVLHAANPAKYGPAGGTENLRGAVELLTEVGAVAAVVVGVNAGAADLAAGVFRELVVTGRSRVALFAARIPGGLAFLLPLVAIGIAVAEAASVALAGGGNAPSAALLFEYAGWVGLELTLAFCLSVGLSSLLGSRSMSVGILLAWQLAVAPLLLQTGKVDPMLLGAALQRIEPAKHRVDVSLVRGRRRDRRLDGSAPCRRRPTDTDARRVIAPPNRKEAMGTPTSLSPRTRRSALLVASLALLAVAVTGCGIGPATDEEKVSKTATTYLRALADGDTARACAQLTSRARGERCESALEARVGRFQPEALTRAADASMDLDVDGDRATAGLSEPEGAHLVLLQVGHDWRIDSGYTVGSAAAARIPATPVGKQLRWALGRLNGGRVAQAAVAARFSPRFLAEAMPGSEIAAMLQRTAAERGPFTFTGFAYPPSAIQAVALLKAKSGARGALRIRVDGGSPARIIGFEVDEAPPIVRATGRYSGRFDVGGRKLFLYCTGSGRPAVVFEGGVTTDWVNVQSAVSRFTRACSYDPANGYWGRSDPAPTPRTAKDVVADLHALLAAANVPGPYVLAGHSNGGLFVQLYASEYPNAVKGLVLIDAVTADYYARRIALLRKLLPPAAWRAAVPALRAPVPATVDPRTTNCGLKMMRCRDAAPFSICSRSSRAATAPNS